MALLGAERENGGTGQGNKPVQSAIFLFFLPDFFLLQPRLRLERNHTITHTMAGDHKCPVCQATFTRPQHVARHMRSRTSIILTKTPHNSHPLLSPTHFRNFSLTNSSPPHRYRRSPIQVSALWRSVCQKVRLSTLIPFLLPVAATLHYLAPPAHAISPTLAISSRDMSTNVTQTKNLLFPLLPLVARAPLLPAERPHRSRRAINAFNPLCHVTVQILVVRLS